LPFAREAVRLGDLISRAKIERCGERSLPVLSMTMHDGITRQSDRFKKVVASRNTSSYKVVQPGQLVVGFPIDEGVIYVQDFDEPGIMSPAYNVWNIDSAKVLPGYLNAALHSPQSMSYYRAKLRGTTARRRTITDANLLALRIPLPDINEQHQIVESLNSIQNDIDSCDSQLDIISSLIKSRFVEMFGDPIENPKGWVKKPIGEVYEVGSAKRVYARDQVSEGIPFLRLGDLTNRIQQGVESCDLYIAEELYEEYKAKGLVPDAGDILVTARGTMGLCYEVKPEDRFYFQDGMITWLHAKTESPLPVFLT
jgi:type I restriction enzyme S subunit